MIKQKTLRRYIKRLPSIKTGKVYSNSFIGGKHPDLIKNAPERKPADRKFIT